MAGIFEKLSVGLGRTRDRFQEQVNVLLDKGPNLDEEFWDGLEEALISADIGASATFEIVEKLKSEATRKALPDAAAVLNLLADRISEQFAEDKKGILSGDKAVILFVGINGTGKTTTVGKIAKEATDLGIKVILGSADTFRAAAIEQLEVWANRANVEMVTRERGSDPASVCYATIERAEEIDADLVLIDTAGRLHTSNDLMEELKKVCNVTRKRSQIPVYVVLVIDATTGQNGLTQAKEFNKFLDLDALIITKLDGTAKGGIALAISKELDLPILKIGVGEKIDDLRNFNPKSFAQALAPGAKGFEDAGQEDEIQNLNTGSENEEIEQNFEQEVETEAEIEVETEVEPKLESEAELEPSPEKEDELETESEPELELETMAEPETIEEEPKKEGKIKGLFKKLFVD